MIENESGTVQVMIVDDSAIVRQTLTKIINEHPKLNVLETAQDPYIAAKKMRDSKPDVIVLDIEMPRMDGLTFLQKIMSQHPLPVIICSSLTSDNSEMALKALELGAIEIINKPKFGTQQFIEEEAVQIHNAILAAKESSPNLKRRSGHASLTATKKLSADEMMAKPTSRVMIRSTEKVIAVGASTGGTEALRIFLEMLPIDSPGVVIVQHMPQHFTKGFATRLNEICHVTVKEAENQDSVLRGHVLIAPGNSHMLLKLSGARYYVEVKSGPLVSRHRPSVDVLFRSAARYGGKNVCGIIMTGMGDDGANGMLEMKEAGALTLAQNEETCIVFGMPKEAIARGGVNQVLPLIQLAPNAVRFGNTAD
ncbi:MAG: chemotaxis response regulator protein-glutamate methylesterase [Proteobacteria bacterium]|nr:chemotaxis response regulator protein-glutamate methylesterase [Pseudomonadota bacterium]